MKVSEIFNDFYSLMTGRKFAGLGKLFEKYREEPLFFVMLSNLSAASEISLLEAMQEAYRLYKEFEKETVQPDSDMEKLYGRMMEYGKKWNNAWCWQLAGALIERLDPDCAEAGSEEKAA